MLAATSNPVLSSSDEEKKAGIIPDAPTNMSLMDFEKKLKEAEHSNVILAPSTSTTIPGKNDLLARVQAAQQRARQKQELSKNIHGTKNDSTEASDSLKVAETKIAPKDPPQLPVPTTTSNTGNLLSAFLQQPKTDTPPPTAPAEPIAPPVVEDTLGFYGLSPVPPPATFGTENTYNAETINDIEEDEPPTFDQFEAEHKSDDIEEMFHLDADGNAMTPERRHEMILEQERILKRIEEEREANDRAIAALTAEEYIQEPEPSTGVAHGATAAAMQLSLDRKLAEKIQKEEYAGARTEEANRNDSKAKQSWSEYLTSLVPGSSTAEVEDEDSKPRSAEIVVGRKSHPRQRSAASIYGGDSEEITFERESDGEQASLIRPGLVAENKPLFSCVVESVSTMLTGQTEVPQGKLHGVDTSSLLSVTNVGRNKGDNDGRGEYQHLNTY